MEHICNIELRVIKSKGANGYFLQTGSGHMAGLYEALAEAQLVEILEIKQLPGGATFYELQNIYKKKDSFKKTTFPPSWSVEKIAQAVQEVYLSNVKIENQENKLLKTLFIDGCNIQICFKNANINGKAVDRIISAYPIV